MTQLTVCALKQVILKIQNFPTISEFSQKKSVHILIKNPGFLPFELVTLMAFASTLSLHAVFTFPVPFCSSWSSGKGTRAAHGLCSSGFLFEHAPVKHVIILMVKRTEEYPEQLPQVHIVRSFFKTKTSAVVQVHGEFCGESLRTR